MANKNLNPSFIAEAAVVLFIALLCFVQFPPFQKIELALYNAYQRLTPAVERPSTRVVLVEIGPGGSEEQPPPRRHIADLLDRLKGAGALRIGLLVPLEDPGASAGYREVHRLREELEAHPLWRQNKKLAEWVDAGLIRIEETLNGDPALVKSLRNAESVFLPVQVHPKGARGSPGENVLSTLAPSLLGPSELPDDFKEEFTAGQISLPLKELSAAAAGFGHTLLSPNQAPGVLSHFPFVRYGGAMIPSMPLRLASEEWNVRPAAISAGAGRLRFKGGEIPLSRGKILVRPSGNGENYRILSDRDVLEGKAGNQLEGKTVLVAIGPGEPGVSEGRTAAEVLDAFLSGRFLKRPAGLRILEALAVLGFGLLGISAAARLSPGKGFLAAGVLSLLPLGTGFGLFSLAGMWVKTGVVTLGVLAGYGLAVFHRAAFRPSAGKEAVETNRLLGLSFQSQGLLDLALEKFKKLPLNDETRDLLYNLGLEYEQRRMTDKALEVYGLINKNGGYRDLNDRIPRLKESDGFSTLGSHQQIRAGSLLADAGERAANRLGRYEILGELGKGSMGLVYKARDPKINRSLAIKTIRFSDEFDEDVIQDIKSRFFTEAEIAGRLSHPYIVTIYDVGEDGDLTYMVMEYLEGTNLDRYITGDSLLPISRVLEITAHVAEALDFAHQSNVIHRDIKPANIMLLDNGTIKVTDFGIAKAISASRTRTGVILGTPNYMSPEQIMGQKIDHRSDIFSLGVLFFQLLTGKLPFHGENLSNLLYQITQVRHPSIREINPRIPKACEQIIDRALAKDPGKRFQRASDMGKLLRLLGGKIEELRRASPPRQANGPPGS